MDPKQHLRTNNTDETTASDIASSNSGVVANASCVSASSQIQPTSLQKTLATGDRVPYTPGPKKRRDSLSMPVSQQPREVTNAVQDVISLWQERTGNTLTNDEANESVANIVGFFKVLIEWDQDRTEDV